MNRLISFLLYEEQQQYIKKNVVVIFQICMLMWCTTVYHAVEGNFSQVIRDSSLLGFIMVMWFLIKKYDKYYPHIAFIILLPMISYAIGVGLYEGDLVELYWIYPAALLFFLILPLKLSLLSCIFLGMITVYLSRPLLVEIMTFNMIVAYVALVGACSFAFRNMYMQYDNLENRANRDTLTQLYNRGLLGETLTESIETAELTQQIESPVILYMDIDHFKTINDSFGHQVGDEVLIGFTNLLKKQFTNHEIFFRMGGEEFVVLVNNSTIGEANHIAENFRKVVENTRLLPNGDNITVSIGISKHLPNESWNYWLKRADDAMYKAKQKGRNKVVINE